MKWDDTIHVFDLPLNAAMAVDGPVETQKDNDKKAQKAIDIEARSPKLMKVMKHLKAWESMCWHEGLPEQSLGEQPERHL